jgi:hypothetical protein
MANRSQWLLRATVFIAPILPALTASGCTQPDLARQRLERHDRSMHWTIDTPAARDRAGAQRTARTVSLAGRGAEREARLARGNLDEIAAYGRRDWERWFQRQPRYGREAGRILRGKPERIERNAIILFF